MRLFRKLLVPTDFSPHAEEALRVALELARSFEAPITLANVFQAPVYPLPEGSFIAFPHAYSEALETARKALESTAASARAAGGPPIETLVLEGVPFREIIGVARTGEFDLIVMGTHGRTGLRHALIGSVAEKVVRKAPCAVLTIRLGSHTFEHP